jgi:RNA polymerase-binding transcription factor DksA
MDLPTQTHLTLLRNLLTLRRHELQTEIHAAELGRRGTAVIPDVGDREDQAMLASIEAVDAAEEERDVRELALVVAALDRLDAGAYGDCAACDEPIPLPRLLAQPAAERCATCQSACEHAG